MRVETTAEVPAGVAAARPGPAGHSRPGARPGPGPAGTRRRGRAAGAFAGRPAGAVTLVWPATEHLPEIEGDGTDGTGLVVTAMRGSPGRPSVIKRAGPETTVEAVTVGGRPGYWISGALHEMQLLDPAGDPVARGCGWPATPSSGPTAAPPTASSRGSTGAAPSSWPRPSGRRVRPAFPQDFGSLARMSDAPRTATLGELRASGWTSVPVKDEIRRNAVARIAAGQQLIPSVIGYGDTVLPQLENAVLAAHDIIFLGERGQAKTRMIRSLVDLLDEWMPIVAGSEINDDPYAPVSRHARDLVEAEGDDAPSPGCTATSASARSWPRPTRRSPTSSARSTPSRWPRAATCPTS